MDSVPEKEGSIKSLFPKLKRGTLKVSKSPELDIDFDWHDREKTHVKLSYIIHLSEDRLRKLKAYKSKLYIFCDELEISIRNKKTRTRDLHLIRDMICTINRYNSIFRAKNIPVFLIAAARSEVLSAPECTGKEINKTYEDCGVLIDWSQSGTNIESEPLIKMVLRKIRASSGDLNCDPNWDNYFDNIIHSDSSKKYILHNSWYRPRDIIRMLTLARDKYPKKNKFDQASFDATRKIYSERCWTEISEAISTEFGIEGVKFIVGIMTGFKKEFSKDELQIRITEHDVESGRPSIYNHKKVRFFLELMYSCGIIGNKILSNRGDVRPTFRFIFRGDNNFLMSDLYIVHFALRPYFSM